MVLVPRKHHDLAIPRSHIEIDVMRESVVVSIGEAGQRREREYAHPVVHIHHRRGGGLEGGRRGIEGLPERHQARVIILVAIILDEVVQAVTILGGAKAADFRIPHDAVSVLFALRISVDRRSRVVNQFLFVERPVVPVRELLLEISRAEAGHSQLGAPVAFGGPRSLKIDDVVEGRGNAPGPSRDDLVKHFVDAGRDCVLEPARAIAPGHIEGAIDDDGLLRSAKRGVRTEADVPASACALPSVGSRPQANARVVPDIAIVVDHRARPAVVRDAVDGGVQLIGVRRRHEEPHLVLH